MDFLVTAVSVLALMSAVWWVVVAVLYSRVAALKAELEQERDSRRAVDHELRDDIGKLERALVDELGLEWTVGTRPRWARRKP